MKTSTAFTYVVFCFTFFPFIWMLMATISTPISSHLQMFRLVDGNNDALLDMGIFGACDLALDDMTGFNSEGADCSSQTSGYSVRTALPLTRELEDTGRFYNIYTVMRGLYTWPLVLVPICAGLVGLSSLLVGIAHFGKDRRWARVLSLVNFGFHIANTCIVWVAFALSLRALGFMRNSTLVYNHRPDAGLDLPIKWKWGNAFILLLVAAIMLILASVLYGLKLFWKRAKVERDHYPLQSRKGSWNHDTASV